jgi:BirA family biotin operon repressor/biotin-[acetyl-CoA-carboxylase] ligase
MNLGEPRVEVESCETTQALLDDSMPEGAIAVADFQTGGRGRLGRAWEAPPRTSLLLSVLLRPPADLPLPQLALVTGIAVADALEHLTGLAVQLKWPNDVMLRRQKVAGVLAEARGEVVVVGIGVNLNQTPDQLPERAGSLRTTTGREWERDEVLGSVLDALADRYGHWLTGGLEAVYDGLGPRDFLRGRRVSVDGTSGTAEMIDRAGRLRIAVGHGESVAVESGEVIYER